MLADRGHLARLMGGRRWRMFVATVLALTAIMGGLALALGIVALDGTAATVITWTGAVSVVGAGLGALMTVNQWVATRAILNELRRAERRVGALIRSSLSESKMQATDHRKAQSRHEYHQEASLKRIESMSGVMRADLEGLLWQAFQRGNRDSPGRLLARRGTTAVLFVTSNGAGVGHLTRCAAIAHSGRALFESRILSLSAAVPVLSELGLEYDYYPSREAAQVDWPVWNRQFARYLHTIVRDGDYSAIVFDGAWIYRGVYEVARRFDVPLIWNARPSWRQTAERQQLKSAAEYCDAVLRPGDITGDDEPVGPGVPVYTTAPIVFGADEKRPARDAACSHLGLDPSLRYVLVQLGAGIINDITDARSAAISAILDLGPNYRAVVARSPLDKTASLSQLGVEEIWMYPLAPWLAAFDACVVAAGYNSVHEAAAARLPMVVVPNLHTVTDDQAWRAQSVEEHGFGVVATDSAGIAAGVRRLAASRSERELPPALSAVGALEAAGIIRSIIEQRA